MDGLRIWFRRINRARRCGSRGHENAQGLALRWEAGMGTEAGRVRMKSATCVKMPIRWPVGEVQGVSYPGWAQGSG